LLSRKIAVKNHYPAIDVLASVSRLFTEINDDPHQQAAGLMRNLMALYKDNEDLISIGAYEKGSNASIDKAIELQDMINSFLQQGIREATPFEEAKQALISMMSQ
jgi:flagellum-specific ATP synthase